MERQPLYVLVAFISLIGAAFVFFMVSSHRVVVSPDSSLFSNVHGTSLFTDSQFGFSIRYPEKYSVEYSFTPLYHLPVSWRINALAKGTTTPIIAIISYRTQSDHSYPRYYDAEVRIGASKDSEEVARCEEAASEQGEQQLADVTLQGTVFKAFSFESAGMMQYAKGVSYRTVHNDACIAIEWIASGSSYREDPKSKDDVPDTVLNAHYEALGEVVKAFSFMQP